MGTIRSLVLLFSSVLCLAACGSAPMKREYWDSSIDTQRQSLTVAERCCRGLSDLSYLPLAEDGDYQIDAQLEIARIEGTTGPALAFDLSAIEEGQSLRFESYSDRRRGALVLNKLLFIRPNAAFLDADHALIATVAEPLMCWGGRKGGGMLWADFPIPPTAKFVVFVPSIRNPVQWVDTRHPAGGGIYLGVLGGAIAESIAEERKSYMSPVYVGLSGLVSVRPIEADEAAPGRCLAEAPNGADWAHLDRNASDPERLPN